MRPLCCTLPLSRGVSHCGLRFPPRIHGMDSRSLTVSRPLCAYVATRSVRVTIHKAGRRLGETAAGQCNLLQGQLQVTMSHLALPRMLLCACMTWLLADCATASSLCRVCSGQEQRSDSRISCTSIIFFAFVLYSIISNPFLLMSILILTGAFIVSRKSQETLSILLPLTRGSSQLPVLNHPPFPCLRKALDTSFEPSDFFLDIGGWTFLLHGRPRPEDGSLVPITIGGRVLSGMEQKAGLGGVTILLMLVTSLGSTIFWALGASMVFVGAHAVTHKIEFHQVCAESSEALLAHSHVSNPLLPHRMRLHVLHCDESGRASN